MKQSQQFRMTLVWLSVFSISMAFLETSVVIYLRELLYPEGFNFPLAPMPERLVLTEFLRELATIVMLAGAGFMAGKTFSSRFAWFLYAFAIWDIFYYVFLKILIGWPESLMTWDLLFLIPTVWTGPVITPVIVSVTMIVLSQVILFFSEKGCNSVLKLYEWIMLVSGSLILITSFILDYTTFMLEHYSFSDLWMLQNKEMIFNTSLEYIPTRFNWLLFIAGEAVLVAAIAFYVKRLRKETVNQ